MLRTWLPVLRVPVVLGLLAVIGRLTNNRAHRLMNFEMDVVWGAWIPVALLAAVTAVAILGARRQRHHPAVLAVEAVAGAVLGFVTPAQWIFWFGFGGIASLVSNVPIAFVQTLAIVWFVTAVGTAWRQRSGDVTSTR